MNYRYTLLLFLATTTQIAQAQLKVGSNGSIGLGIEPHPEYKLAIKGDLLLTTWPEIPPPLTNWTEFRFKVGNGWPGCEFGTPSKKIAVWYSGVGYNDLYAAHFYQMSDSLYKTQVEPIKSGNAIISQLIPISYHLRDTIGGPPTSNTQYGFIAQDLLQVIPSIVDSSKGDLLVDYTQLIPFLARAIQEQQLIIDSLLHVPTYKMEGSDNFDNEDDLWSLIYDINELKQIITECCRLNQEPERGKGLKSKLFQNKPNPFSDDTVIEYQIIGKNHSANILIFSSRGTLIENFEIEPLEGVGAITLSSTALAPGVYTYSLMLDGTEADSKKMVLLE